MIKGISKNVVCDSCIVIITGQDYDTIQGKKRILHYCKNPKCQLSKDKSGIKR